MNVRDLMASVVNLYKRRFFLRRHFQVQTAVRTLIESEIRQRGLELERVLKIRPHDFKSVVLCRHPRWGRCVFKGFPMHRATFSMYAHVETARQVAEMKCALFPEVLEVGATYSIEEYVSGRRLCDIAGPEWRAAGVTGLLDDVRSFSLQDQAQLITRDELTILFVDYVEKAFRYPVYQVAWKRLRGLLQLVFLHGQLQEGLVDCVRSLDRVDVARGRVINDLGVGNIVMRSENGSLYVIDTEHLGRGHYMFDCVWFLISLGRCNAPPDVIRRAYEHIFSASFVESSEHAACFRKVLTFLGQVNSIGERDASRYLLALVREDVKRE